ncbi:hypothetical protein [Sutterella wadsworthensis]
MTTFETIVGICSLLACIGLILFANQALRKEGLIDRNPILELAA